MLSEMQSLLVYLTTFFMVFLSFMVFSLCLRILLWIYMKYYNNRRNRINSPSDMIDIHSSTPDHPSMHTANDRQGNIFTIADETSNNSAQHRCPDFFYVEPSAENAARIQAQLEKDEKDLPTYEEVMAMSAAQTHAGSMVAPHNDSNTSIATTNTTVPPYSEINTNMSQQVQLPVGNISVDSNEHNSIQVFPVAMNTVAGSGIASTSHAAVAVTSSTGPKTTVTIANSVSNTSDI